MKKHTRTVAVRKSRMGREYRKPTDQRRGAVKPLTSLGDRDVREFVSVNGRNYVNVVIDGVPRTLLYKGK
jgi:hypothetical protein